MEEEFCTNPLQTPCLTQCSSVPFSNLHQSIDSVSSNFHQPSFTTSSLEASHNDEDKSIIGFSQNVLPIRIYDELGGDGSIELVKDTVDGDKLAELCQASDAEDEQVSKLAHDNGLGVITSDEDGRLLPSQSSDKHYKKCDVDGHQETKSANIDPSDASDLLREIQEENKKRMHDIFTTSIDVPQFHVVDETTILEMEKLSQEKNTLFSENLGLIAKDSKEFKTLTQLKPARKRIRTRQSIWGPMSPGDVETVPEAGHKHVKCTYKCGSCMRSFTEMCKLHDHLVNHGYGGSYHYDHILKTAFPKYDSVCAFTQTKLDECLQDTTVDKKLTIKPLRNVVKPKSKTVVEKKKLKNDTIVIMPLSPSASKKRRGRPSRGGVDKEAEQPKLISKLKVKTEDGGNTWQGVGLIGNVARTEDGKIGEEESNTNDMDIHLTDDNLQAVNEDSREEKAKQTSLLVSEYIKENQNDITTQIDNDKSPEGDEKIQAKSEKKSRKRKSSVPRKLLPIDTMPGKIVNSRAKPEKKIGCDFCPCTFQYTRGLIRHEQEKHAEEMKFECEICKMKFMREYNKDRHLLCAHPSEKPSLLQGKELVKTKKKPGRKRRSIVPEGDVTCEECGKVLPESKAVIHARMHTGDRPFICHFCGKGLISDKKLKRHLLIHSNVMRHTCEVCGQGFSMKYKLKTHMYIHTGHKPYLCSVCGAEFNNSTSLLHHHRTVHLGDKRFECSVCGGKYGKKSQLEEHMFSHSNERTQTCRYCGKTFKHAKSLRRHESTHVSSDKFQCDQCDSKFSRKDNLERHKMCHFDVTLQCRFCKKKFRERQPLEDHEQFHINQKRLQCHICKEKFLDESYFYKHMETEHEMTPDMLPAVNILPPNGKDNIGVDVGQDNNIIFSSMKLPVSGNNGDTGNQSVLSAAHQDTLNLSMNAAGIIPTTSQDLLGSGTQSNMQSLLVTPHAAGQQAFNQNTVSLNINTSRILNQPINPSFVAANHLIPGLHEGQRAIVNVINADDTVAIRLPLDQSTSEMMMIHEQQRLMQEALGSSLNMQNTSYRLQNLY